MERHCTGLKIKFSILGNVQCRAKFHVDFSETEGNFALYCTISFTFLSVQIEGNTTFFLVLYEGLSLTTVVAAW